MRGVQVVAAGYIYAATNIQRPEGTEMHNSTNGLIEQIYHATEKHHAHSTKLLLLYWTMVRGKI